MSSGVASGTGSETDPYQLASPTHFLSMTDYFGNLTSSPSDACWQAHFEMTSSVDLSTASPWTPIGTGGAPFRGTFDGGNLTIASLTLSATSTDHGFFGATERAVIRDVTLSPVNVEVDASDVGSLVGDARRTTFRNVMVHATITATDTSNSVGGVAGGTLQGTLENVSVDVTLSGGDSEIGGVVGHTQETVLRNVTTTATLWVSPSDGSGSKIGGVVGYLEHGAVDSSEATIDVTFGGTETVGGLFGEAKAVRIESVSVSGLVTGRQHVGGIAGKLRDGSTLQDARFTGTVLGLPSGDGNMGGLVGETRNGARILHASSNVTVSSVTSEVGGLVGDAEDTFIAQVSSTGTIYTESERAGGLIGYANRATVERATTDASIEGANKHAGGVVGDSEASTFIDVAAFGTVSATEWVGGFGGYVRRSTVEQSFAMGNVTGTLEYLGGLLGYVEESFIRDTYATGSVSVTDVSATDIGGLIGYVDRSEVERSFATGDVKATGSTVGGLYGRVQTTTLITNAAFWDTERTNQAAGSGDPTIEGTGVSTTDLRSHAFLDAAGWAIANGARSSNPDTVWGICDGSSDPFLLWQVADDGSFMPDTATKPSCVSAVTEPAPVLSSEARLVNLTVDAGTLTPSFAPDRASYALDAPADVTRVTITVRTMDDAATVTIDGVGGGTGTATARVTVDADPRSIPIVVTAEDGTTTRSYQVDVARAIATTDAPTNLGALPDDGAAWITFTAPDVNFSNLEVRIDGGAWQPFLPSITTSPVRIDGLTNGRPATVRLRVVTDAGVGAASSAVTVTPRAQASVPLTIDGNALTVEATEVSEDGAIRIRARAVIRNDGATAMEDVWIAPRTTGSTILGIETGTAGTALIAAGDAWYWPDANLAPGATAPLIVILEVR